MMRGLYGYGGYGMMGGFGWFGMLICLLIVVLVVLGIISLFKGGFNSTHKRTGISSKERSLEILKERLARGEISKEEYESIKRDL